jgi:hypothetical protein
MRRKWSHHEQLRIVVQAIGMYCMVNGLFSFFKAVAVYVAYGRPDRTSPLVSIRPVLMDNLIYAVLVLALSGVLLAKADWCARVVAGMSKPPDETEPED